MASRMSAQGQSSTINPCQSIACIDAYHQYRTPGLRHLGDAVASSRSCIRSPVVMQDDGSVLMQPIEAWLLVLVAATVRQLVFGQEEEVLSSLVVEARRYLEDVTAMEEM
jgi:hypothetical protein